MIPRLSAKPKRRRYQVWIDQINQDIVEVLATDEHDAREKAEKKWRRETYPTATQVRLATK